VYITGETKGAQWQEENRRVSGDKLLHSLRKEQSSILG